MGLMKSIKNALVEEVPREDDSYDSSQQNYTYEQPVEEEQVEISLDGVNTNTLIEDIYKENGLEDRSRSIFKVEEMINTLPKEMTTDVKRASVTGILSSFGLTTMEVIDDGDLRTKILKAANEKIASENDKKISEANAIIERLKGEIADSEKVIANAQEEKKKSNNLINDEIEKVKGLVEFIGGE